MYKVMTTRTNGATLQRLADRTTDEGLKWFKTAAYRRFAERERVERELSAERLEAVRRSR